MENKDYKKIIGNKPVNQMTFREHLIGQALCGFSSDPLLCYSELTEHSIRVADNIIDQLAKEKEEIEIEESLLLEEIGKEDEKEGRVYKNIEDITDEEKYYPKPGDICPVKSVEIRSIECKSCLIKNINNNIEGWFYCPKLNEALKENKEEEKVIHGKFKSRTEAPESYVVAPFKTKGGYEIIDFMEDEGGIHKYIGYVKDPELDDYKHLVSEHQIKNDDYVYCQWFEDGIVENAFRRDMNIIGNQAERYLESEK